MTPFGTPSVTCRSMPAWPSSWLPRVQRSRIALTLHRTDGAVRTLLCRASQGPRTDAALREQLRGGGLSVFSHERALELAATAIDFGLIADDAASLETHLATCSSCRHTATALRRDAESMRRTTDQGAPTERVLQAVIVAARRPPHRSKASAWLWLAAAWRSSSA